MFLARCVIGPLLLHLTGCRSRESALLSRIGVVMCRCGDVNLSYVLRMSSSQNVHHSAPCVPLHVSIFLYLASNVSLRSPFFCSSPSHALLVLCPRRNWSLREASRRMYESLYAPAYVQAITDNAQPLAFTPVLPLPPLPRESIPTRISEGPPRRS